MHYQPIIELETGLCIDAQQIWLEATERGFVEVDRWCSAVFSKDTARALRVAARIESGICHINGATVHDEPQMPFGGVKSSGIGRFGAKAGIEAFTDLRWVTLQTSARAYPF